MLPARGQARITTHGEPAAGGRPRSRGPRRLAHSGNEDLHAERPWCWACRWPAWRCSPASRHGHDRNGRPARHRVGVAGAELGDQHRPAAARARRWHHPGQRHRPRTRGADVGAELHRADLRAAGRGRRPPRRPVRPGGRNVYTLVFQTGRSARIDGSPGTSGPDCEVARELGVRAAVGVPVSVEGRLSGAMIVASKQEEPLPAGTEARLAGFTELAATAIANAEAQVEVAARTRRTRRGTRPRRRRRGRRAGRAARDRPRHPPRSAAEHRPE